MPNRNREAGDRLEYKTANLFKEAGIPAQRVPNSGSSGGVLGGDVLTAWIGQQRKLECKWQRDGHKQIYKWLEGNDALVIAASRKPPIICLPLDNFLDILSILELEAKT